MADAVGVPEDPWPGFVRAESRHRRTRRIRTAVAAGVVAALVGVQTNVVPLPGWAPGVAVASPALAWADAPPRGSLVHDRVWLDGLREWIGSGELREEWETSRGLWKVGDSKRIRVLYADEVPGHRVVLAVVPYRLGLLTQWILSWYVGPAGATPDQMHPARAEKLGESVTALQHGTWQEGGFAVVVGPADATVTISGDHRYTPAGRLEYRQLATSGDAGVGVAALPPGRVPPSVVAEVRRGDEVLYQGEVFGSWSGPAPQPELVEEIEALLPAAVRDSRGPAVDPAVLAGFVRVALENSLLPAAGTTVRVRWTGTVNDQPAALITVQPTGGGVIAYAMHGTAHLSRMDLRLLVPAEGADRRPFGWRLRAEGGDDRTDQVVVVTPPGTATASVTIGAGPEVPVALDPSGAGRTTVPTDQPATVTAYAADGSVVGRTPIPLFEDNISSPPGANPESRVVE
ncbi:hypothetical protein EF879_13975 [Micromonospora sp. HM5-17]|nr:hypothetical protein EF879_13975 [Micromonospora sp. HM5-17]